MTEAEAKLVLNDVLVRYQRNSYDQLLQAARDGERIDGQVPGPESGAFYPVIIATDWVDEPQGNIRVLVVVHDDGSDRFGHVHGDFVKTPDDTVVTLEE